MYEQADPSSILNSINPNVNQTKKSTNSASKEQKISRVGVLRDERLHGQLEKIFEKEGENNASQSSDTSKESSSEDDDKEEKKIVSKKTSRQNDSQASLSVSSESQAEDSDYNVIEVSEFRNSLIKDSALISQDQTIDKSILNNTNAMILLTSNNSI